MASLARSPTVLEAARHCAAALDFSSPSKKDFDSNAFPFATATWLPGPSALQGVAQIPILTDGYTAGNKEGTVVDRCLHTLLFRLALDAAIPRRAARQGKTNCFPFSLIPSKNLPLSKDQCNQCDSFIQRKPWIAEPKPFATAQALDNSLPSRWNWKTSTELARYPALQIPGR